MDPTTSAPAAGLTISVICAPTWHTLPVTHCLPPATHRQNPLPCMQGVVQIKGDGGEPEQVSLEDLVPKLKDRIARKKEASLTQATPAAVQGGPALRDLSIDSSA